VIEMKKRLLILVTLLFNIAGGLEVYGSDWILSHKGEVASYYYDTESMIRQEDGTIRVWEKAVFDNRNLEIWWLHEYNCKNRTFRNLEIFDIKEGDRTYIKLNKNDKNEVHHVVPDSDMERFFMIICK
jgi:hypothetical protein